MGAAAYKRGSERIAKSIQSDFEKSPAGRRQLIEQMTRASEKVVELDSFCLNAQALYVDIVDEDTSKGLLKGNMHDVWLKKHQTKAFKAMMSKCLEAHCAWVDSDVRHVFNHLAVCRAKATAWFNVLEHLNVDNFRFHFDIPSI